MLHDDDAEAWELANKVIADLTDKYDLRSTAGTPEGVLRDWLARTASAMPSSKSPYTIH